jgi:hypothetical protein
LGYICYFKKLSKVNNRPKGAKIIHSDHPDFARPIPSSSEIIFKPKSLESSNFQLSHLYPGLFKKVLRKIKLTFFTSE